MTNLNDVLNDETSFAEHLLNSDEKRVIICDPPTSFDVENDDGSLALDELIR